MSGWTEDRSDLAKKLWTVDGYSASQIARALGGGISRNAVIGRLSRMGLTGDGENARKQASALGARRAAAALTPTRVYRPRAAPALKIAGRGTVFEEAPARPARAAAPFRDEPAGRRDLLTLQAHECRFPIGDPQEAGFSFCGSHAPTGPYCDTHAPRCFVSAATRTWVDKKLAMPPRERIAR